MAAVCHILARRYRARRRRRTGVPYGDARRGVHGARHDGGRSATCRCGATWGCERGARRVRRVERDPRDARSAGELLRRTSLGCALCRSFAPSGTGVDDGCAADDRARRRCDNDGVQRRGHAARTDAALSVFIAGVPRATSVERRQAGRTVSAAVRDGKDVARACAYDRGRGSRQRRQLGDLALGQRFAARHDLVRRARLHRIRRSTTAAGASADTGRSDAARASDVPLGAALALGVRCIARCHWPHNEA